MRQWCCPIVAGIMQRMLGMRDLHTLDLQGLAPEAVAALAAQMLGHIRQQDAIHDDIAPDHPRPDVPPELRDYL